MTKLMPVGQENPQNNDLLMNLIPVAGMTANPLGFKSTSEDLSFTSPKTHVSGHNLGHLIMMQNRERKIEQKADKIKFSKCEKRLAKSLIKSGKN